MTFATLIEFVIKNWKIVCIGFLVLVLGVYIGNLKHTISKDNKIIDAKDQQIVDLKAGIQVQNLAITQMEKYAQQRDVQIADATRLAESLQDEITLKAQQILTRDTKIEGTINTLADCTGELGRIKGYMISAEQEFIKQEQR